MIGLIDLAAIVAPIATIYRPPRFFAANGLLAIDCFGQGSGHRLKRKKFAPGEKKGMCQPSAFEHALEQMHDLRVFGVVRE